MQKERTKMSRIAGSSLSAVTILVLVSLSWARWEVLIHDPQGTVRDFNGSGGRAAEQILDSMILTRGSFMPLVLTEVQERHWRIWRYAVGFPGSGGDPEALDELESIVSDVQESHHVRADA